MLWLYKILGLSQTKDVYGFQLKRCVHKLSKSQKNGFEKIAIEVVDMQTAKIQLNSGVAKYILYGSA